MTDLLNETVTNIRKIAKKNKIKNYSKKTKKELIKKLEKDLMIIEEDINSRTTSKKNTDELLKIQDYKCANNPNNKFYLGPRDYYCPQWKYNNGFLEESHHVPFGYIFDIDHKKEFSKSGDNSFENKQILCLNCHRIKTNVSKLNRNLSCNIAYSAKANMDLC